MQVRISIYKISMNIFRLRMRRFLRIRVVKTSKGEGSRESTKHNFQNLATFKVESQQDATLYFHKEP